MTQKGKRGHVVHLTTHLQHVLPATVPLMQEARLLCTHIMALGIHGTER